MRIESGCLDLAARFTVLMVAMVWWIAGVAKVSRRRVHD